MTLRFPRAKFIQKKDDERLKKLDKAFSVQSEFSPLWLGALGKLTVLVATAVRDLGKAKKRMSGKEDLSRKKKAKFTKVSEAQSRAR